MTGDSRRLWPTRAATELGVFSVKAGLRSPVLSHHGASLSTLQCLGQISMEMPQRAGLPRLICGATEAGTGLSASLPASGQTRAGTLLVQPVKHGSG